MPQARPKLIETPQNGLRRILADNASAMTHWGTNSYILGSGQVAVIDPGPADPGHMQAILASLQAGETISHIFVTHSHVDHSSLAGPLSKATGAPVFAFGGPAAGRSKVMREIAKSGLVGGGEGVDLAFWPDETLSDGQSVSGPDWTLTALWTPGHMGNHLCFSWEDAIFTGDHVMGWASSLVSPPDGDLSDFMKSTRRLAKVNAQIFYPGHGAPVSDPANRIEWLIRHRLGREAAILAALAISPATIPALSQRIYNDIDPSLLLAAERNLFAHLVDLVQSCRVSPVGQLNFSSEFKLV